jgi:hypothetical protein
VINIVDGPLEKLSLPKYDTSSTLILTSLFEANLIFSETPSYSDIGKKSVTLDFSSIAVLVLLSSLMASLGLLIHLSGPDHRLSSSSGIVSVICVHTPAVIALFIGWIWQSLDVNVRKLTPWGSMCRSDGIPAKARESVLLDYASPSLPVAVYRAFQNRHWPVVLSVLGIGVCGAISIISTYLLALQPFETSSKGDFIVTSSFDSSLSMKSNISSGFLDAFLSQRLLNASIPSQVAADKWVVETVESVDPDIVWYKVNATAWSAELDCHPGTIVYNGYSSTETPQVPSHSDVIFSVVISSDGCNASYMAFQDELDFVFGEHRTDQV